jgi:glutaredoxin-like protein NrdH
MAEKRVPGKNKGDILIYGLSTCGWCRKTKSMLDQLGVEYCYVDVDLEEGDERSLVTKELRNWNPALSFPTVVINKDMCIVGFNEQKIKEALGL